MHAYEPMGAQKTRDCNLMGAKSTRDEYELMDSQKTRDEYELMDSQKTRDEYELMDSQKTRDEYELKGAQKTDAYEPMGAQNVRVDKSENHAYKPRM